MLAVLVVVGVEVLRSLAVHVELALSISDSMFIALAEPFSRGKGGRVGLVPESMPTWSMNPRGGDGTSRVRRCGRLGALGESQLIP